LRFARGAKYAGVVNNDADRALRHPIKPGTLEWELFLIADGRPPATEVVPQQCDVESATKDAELIAQLKPELDWLRDSDLEQDDAPAA